MTISEVAQHATPRFFWDPARTVLPTHCEERGDIRYLFMDGALHSFTGSLSPMNGSISWEPMRLSTKLLAYDGFEWWDDHDMDMSVFRS